MRRYIYISILLLISIFVQNELNAQCTSDAGSLPGDIISTCAKRLDFDRPQNHVLDDNDVLGLIAFKDKDNPLGSVLNKLGYFNNIVSSIGTGIDTLFYVAAVAGDSLPNRFIDLDDPCLSISNILTIRAGFIDVNIPYNCRGDSIPFNLSGAPPFSGWLVPEPGMFDTIFINSNTDYAVNLPPDISSVKYDITSEREGCNREWTEYVGISMDCGVPLPDKITCTNTSVTLEPMAVGGTPPYRYDWNNGMVGSPITVTEPGNYSATATDAGGCTIVCPLLRVESELTLGVATTFFCPGDSIPFIMGSFPPFSGYIAYQFNDGSMDTLFLNETRQRRVNFPPDVVRFDYSLTDARTSCFINDSFDPTTGLMKCQATATNKTLDCVNSETIIEFLCQGGGRFYEYEITGPDGFTTNIPWFTTNVPGTYTAIVTDRDDCQVTEEITIEFDSTVCGSIIGNVLLDEEGDCIFSSNDSPLDCWILKAFNAQNTFYATTQPDGSYVLPVLPGDYSLQVITPNSLFDACNGIQIVTVANIDDVVNADFLIKNLFDCPLMEVSMGSFRPRRCFGDRMYMTYCNNGTVAADDVYIELITDPLLDSLEANYPFTTNGDTAFFQIGTVEPFECKTISMSYHTSCDASLNQTLCVEAIIYPNEPCPEPSPLWLGASIRIDAECVGDSILYIVKNVGTGDMTEPREYSIIEDVTITHISDPFTLAAGEMLTGSIPAIGATVRIEVEQEDNHPGISKPSISIERCGSNPFSTQIITQFPPDDGDAHVDVQCEVVRGSYDPNDKRAEPEGYSSEHFIDPNTNLEYTIRFQNTGNDTAFTVEILDTLSQFLDVGSVNPGVSSHDYRFEVFETGILRFTFNDILLVDSFTNEPASNGFVKYSIDQKPDVVLGSVIYNAADIYFDFNAPIYTNQTFHTVGRDFITVKTQEIFVPGAIVNVYPNPFNDKATFEIKNAGQGQKTLRLLDISGKVVYSQTVHNEQFILERKNLNSGFYFYEITSEGTKIATGKLVVE